MSPAPARGIRKLRKNGWQLTRKTVKTGDPEDHLKNFQTVAKIERWAMPTWCHMFNSTLMGATRLWFDELQPESINSFVELCKAFLALSSNRRNTTRIPWNSTISRREIEGNSTKSFMDHFKLEILHVKGA
ncbi:hypothetical protein Tco_0487233 [Tanacetum coccineum]